MNALFDAGPSCRGDGANWFGTLSLFLALLFTAAQALAADSGYPGRNVNIVGPPPPGSGQLQDNGLRQQNEPSCAVNPADPHQICCGFNDYRGVDVPELGDAWEAIACSRDGGHNWHSELIAGNRRDPVNSLDLDFAADPNLVAAPGGLFFNFIASNRDEVGGIYILRFAWRNKEDGWPLAQVGGPILISKGTSGRFIDKPNMIGFLDDSSDALVTMEWTSAGALKSRQLPAGNLGMAAAVFVGNDNNDGTKILYWNSSDWGLNWDQPTKLTESKGVNSGVSLAANGDTVCAIWRRFQDTNEPHSILYACSTNRGKTFGKPKLLAQMCPFDQTTLNGEPPTTDIVSFRTNAFPVLASDGTNFYAFWSDRGYAAASGFGDGCNLRDADGNFNPSFGRIVYSVSSNGGQQWSAPAAVEDAPTGHQFMPAAFGADGEVMLAWVDNRDDIAHFLDVDKQLIVDFWKSDVALYRHTLDIRSARLLRSASGVTFAPSVKVSSYTNGLMLTDTGFVLRQLEYNLGNARLFKQGTAPFIGDYLAMTADAYNKDSSGKWLNSNSAPRIGTPVFHIAWGDNRDVRGNAWGDANADGFDAPSPYTPSNPNVVNGQASGGGTANTTPSVQDAPDNQQQYCEAATIKADRTRDQNVYFASVYPVAVLTSPGAIKVTGEIQRALPVFLQNHSSEVRYFRLDINGQPSDYGACTGVASFRQYSAEESGSVCPLPALTSVWVKVQPRSSAVRTVFQISASDPLPAIPVSASLCQAPNGTPDPASCEVVNEIVLNQDVIEFGNTLEQPDSAFASIFSRETHNPDLLNPLLLNPDLLKLLLTNPDLLNTEVLNSNLLNPDVLNPDLLNLILENPDLLNIALLNSDLINPDLLNPDLLNPDLLNPDLLNPDLLNLVVANPDLLNPDLLNATTLNPDLMNPDLLNLILANPDILNPDLLNLVVENPDLLNPDLLNVIVKNPDILNVIVANPDLLNPDLLNADLLNPDLLNPDLLNQALQNPDLLNPDLLNLVLLNPDLLNPDLLNQALLNPDLLNPDLLNPDLLNLLVSNPDLLNPDLLNPDLLNPDLMNPDLLNAAVSYSDLENSELQSPGDLGTDSNHYVDVTWQVKNTGNTTTGYMAQSFIAGPQEYTATQLIISRPYLRQTMRNCLPVVESYNHVLVTITNPPNQEPIVNPDPSDESVEGIASYWLAPGEVVNVTLRIFADDPAKLHPDRAGLYVSSEACNTRQGCLDKPYVITSRKADYTGPVLMPDTIADIGGVEASGPAGSVVEFTTPTAYDEGDAAEVPVYCSVESGATFPIGTTADQCAATDSAGNSTVISFTVEVQDTVAPSLVIAPPAGFTFPVEASGPDGATIDFADWVESTDAVDGDPQISCAPESGSSFPLGTTTISCTATDFSGNATTATLDVTVADTTPPQVSVPAGMHVEATSASGALVNYGVTATDVVDPTLELSCDPPPGLTFPLGATLVQCSATDDAGNVGYASFTVTVADSIAPVLAIHGPITVEAESPAGTVVQFDVSAIDAVDAQVTVACAPESGSIFPIGDSQVICTGTDDSGNASSGSFTIHVVDTTPPDLIVPDDIIVAAQSDAGAYVDFVVTATDVADADVEIICSPPSGSLFPYGTSSVTCTATDDAGNAATAGFSILVQLEIIWIKPVEDPYSYSIGPNLNLRWGYGVNGQLEESGYILDTGSGKGTDPVAIYYLGARCDSGTPEVVDLDAGNSSLRYSAPDWQLNWQTSQSTLNGLPLIGGCYLVEIPRAEGRGGTDTKHILLIE